MPEALYHQLLMLRPMQAGVSGYARLQGEAGRQLLQLHLRGLAGGGLRAFWYAGEGQVQELGSSMANPRGEAGLYTQLPAEGAAPRRLTALLLTTAEQPPRPLAIGLCPSQSAGSLLDARNALLALCDRLCHPEQQTGGSATAPAASPAEGGPAGQAAHPAGGAAPAADGHSPACAAAPQGKTEDGEELRRGGKRRGKDGSLAPQAAPVRQPGHTPPPREVFLPAIDLSREGRRSRKASRPPQSSCPAQEPPAASGGRDAAARSTPRAGAPVAPDGSRPPQSSCPEQEPPAASGCRGAAARSTPRAGAPVAPDGSRPPQSSSPAQEPPAASGGRGAAARRSAANPQRPAVDRLPGVQWPAAFRELARCFDQCLPVALMGWPGWRFVEVQGGGAGLWIGCLRQQERIGGIAYVLPGDAPAPAGQPFREALTVTGQPVQVLVLKA